MRRAKILAWIAALLALALPAVMAYLGSHSRLFADDYCVIAWGENLAHGILYCISGILGLAHTQDFS